MRATLEIDDNLMAEAKGLAAREHTTLTRIFEKALALRLRAQATPSRGPLPPLPVFAGKGGLQATVADSLSHRALLDAADGTA